MNRIKELFIKYKSLIMYAIFGALTTLVNWASYYLCYNVLKISNVPSTIIAWFLAVAFAFITNKLWVFDSKSFNKKTLVHEIWTFFTARALTGVLDVIIMFVAVDMLNWNSTVWKLISNVLVIILNYILSKIFVFRKNKTDSQQKTH